MIYCLLINFMGFFSNIFGSAKKIISESSLEDKVAAAYVFNNMRRPHIEPPAGVKVISVSPRLSTPIVGGWKIKYQKNGSGGGIGEFTISKNTTSRSGPYGEWKFIR